MNLDFTHDGEDTLVLCDKVYEGCTFSHLDLPSPIDKVNVIRNCRFLDCETYPGVCWLRNGVRLEEVEFVNLRCGDAIRMDSEVVLRCVTISGKVPALLWMKPSYGQPSTVIRREDCEFQLDIKDFEGDVELIGIYGDTVRKNSSRHVTMRACWKDEIDWKALGIGGLSCWRIYLRKLIFSQLEEGVFSLPGDSSKRYEEVMQEKSLLEKAGLCFA